MDVKDSSRWIDHPPNPLHPPTHPPTHLPFTARSPACLLWCVWPGTMPAPSAPRATRVGQTPPFALSRYVLSSFLFPHPFKTTSSSSSFPTHLTIQQEISHGANAGLTWATQQLQAIKDQVPEISYADLYQLASVVGVEVRLWVGG